MSSSTALGITPDRRPVDLAEFRNGHGWSPSIWTRLVRHNGFGDDYMSWGPGPDPVDELWKVTEELPEWQQAALVLTFDTGVIPFQAFDWAVDGLREFESKLPANPLHVNHVPAMADLIATHPEVPMFGVWGTSVSENPFDPWDHDADDSGSGIPLSEIYLLPLHHDYPQATEATP